MKTKTTYPENANKAKALLVAGLILIQASLIAGDSSSVKQSFNYTNDAYIAGTELPNALNTENSFCYLYEEAYEPEMEIEDWMCNIYSDYLNANSDEEEIELEDWMYNTQNSFWKDLDETMEQELAIEDWMTKPEKWFDTTQEIVLTSK